jgi:hypothetical protein
MEAVVGAEDLLAVGGDHHVLDGCGADVKPDDELAVG